MDTNDFTPKISETVHVEKMLTDLVPGFLKNKYDDVDFINSLIEKNEFSRIKKIGHDWKGACPSYGFEYLGEVGKQFDAAIVSGRLTDLVRVGGAVIKQVIKRGRVAYTRIDS